LFRLKTLNKFIEASVTIMKKIKMKTIKPVKILMKPFQKFFGMEASASILLLITAFIAIIWANTPYADQYFELWQYHLSFSLGEFGLSKPLFLWINDGLMAIFFFVIGLEIKREILGGELSSFKKATLPFFAALGGIFVPLALFLLLNSGKPGAEGWGIPMATDIAFSLGILKLLGKRVPLGLKIFLTTFAIIDDIGAVLVIGIFYTSNVMWLYIIIAMVLLFILMLINKLQIDYHILYLLIGLVIWYLFLKSGIHPTIAGVLVAFTIPANKMISPHSFADKMKLLLSSFKNGGQEKRFLTTEQLSATYEAESLTYKIQPLSQRLENRLHGWVAYFIMPVFALANAGVSLTTCGWQLHRIWFVIAKYRIIAISSGRSLGYRSLVGYPFRFRIAYIAYKHQLPIDLWSWNSRSYWLYDGFVHK
jgi:NhaA family Na+:H+ antiporter